MISLLPFSASAEPVKSSSPNAPRSVAELSTLPFVQIDGPSSVSVSFADEHAAFAALSSNPGATENLVVNVEDVPVLPSEQRRARDAAAAANDSPIRPTPACTTLTAGPRVAGVALPHLGCNRATGEQLVGAAVPGDRVTSVRAALGTAAAAAPTDKDVGITVQDAAGELTVDVSAAWANEMLKLPNQDRVLAGQALVVTALSNPAVRSVRFTADGDCFLFALATGGDACVTHTPASLVPPGRP